MFENSTFVISILIGHLSLANFHIKKIYFPKNDENSCTKPFGIEKPFRQIFPIIKKYCLKFLRHE